MSKKKLLCILMATVLLTGCGKTSDSILNYSSTIGADGYKANESFNLVDADLFSKDLCVIPKGTQNKRDLNLPATAALMVDVSNKDALYANNIYKKIYPASITKIATAYMAFKYGNMDDIVTISHNAANITESGAKLCGFKEGDKILLRDLLTSLLIYSGNDAGIAIAEHISITEKDFAKKMTEEVKNLGAVNTNFVNAHGLHDDNHYTTAYDLYLIFNELIKNEDFLSIIKMTSFTASYKDVNGNSIEKTFETTNRYLKGELAPPDGMTVLGGKTGTTFKAGSCLILYSKNKTNNQYISVVLKAATSDSLFNQMTYLLDFSNK